MTDDPNLPDSFGTNPAIRDPIADERDEYKRQRDVLLAACKATVLNVKGNRYIEEFHAQQICRVLGGAIKACEKGM